MRPIKFRAWDNENKVMVNERLSIARIISAFIKGTSGDGFQAKDFEKSRYALMQFTGLHDKNGKEIWEGDVVRWLSATPEALWTKDEVYYSGITGGPALRMFPACGLSGFTYIEVLGNIYENPELLSHAD